MKLNDTCSQILHASLTMRCLFLLITLSLVCPSQAQIYACDDDRERKFFAPSTDKHEPCVWLAARPEEQAALCDAKHPSQAFYICRETCGQCQDECEDTQDEFLYSGVLRNCLWLSLRNWVQDEVCGSMDSDADNACPETCNVCDSPAQVIETDVVIIGAGVAGIRAAERIAEIDPSLDVSVLEASERIGGRTYTEFNVGVEGNQWTIENGANWVYRNTSFYDRAVALSVETKAQELFSIVLYSYVPCVDETGDRGNKRVLSESHLQRFLDALEAENVSTHKKMHYQRLLRRLAEEGPAECSSELVPEEDVFSGLEVFLDGPYNCTGENSTLLWFEAVDEEGNPLVVDVGTLAQYIGCGYNRTDPIQFFWKFYLQDVDPAKDDGSLYGWFDYIKFTEKEEIVVDQAGGYQSIIEKVAMEAGITPIFDRRVTKVKYDHFRDDYRALVFAAGTSTEMYAIYEAKRVISTVAAPVLSFDMIEFEPSLRYPEADFNPMQGRVALKVFYQFPSTFWDDSDLIFTVNSEDPSSEDPNYWMNLNRVLPGSNMILLWGTSNLFQSLVGPENLTVEEIPQEKLEDMLQPFRLSYPETFQDPVSIYYNKWHADPLTGYNAYTDWEVGFDPYDYYAFYGAKNETFYIFAPCEHNGCNGEPEENATEWILYLSGAASCLEFYELAHGAYYAGEVAANNVMESLNYTEAEIGFWYDRCYFGINSTLEELVLVG